MFPEMDAMKKRMIESLGEEETISILPPPCDLDVGMRIETHDQVFWITRVIDERTFVVIKDPEEGRKVVGLPESPFWSILTVILLLIFILRMV